MPTDLTQLEALARAATQGERKFEPHPYGYGYSVLWVPETRTEILATGGRNDGDDPITWMGEELTDADREFIEAANPAAVLALIERVRELEAMPIVKRGFTYAEYARTHPQKNGTEP